MIPAPFLRALGLALLTATLAACARQDLDEAPPDLGPFRLGLNIVVADNMQKVPISRDATVDEWEAGIRKAVADRFGRYQGDRFYNIGINVDAYALAPPGIPVVAAPKSVVVVTANIWDDATQTRLNPEPKQFIVFENLSGDTVIGSGYTKTREEQLAALSYNAAKVIEGWFLANPQWFAAAGAIPGAPVKTANSLEPAPTLMSGPAATAAPPVAPNIGITPLPAAPGAPAEESPLRPRPRPLSPAPAN